MEDRLMALGGVPEAPPEVSVDLATLIEWYDAAEDSTLTARTRAERDRDYYDGKQYTDTELEEYRKRRQPPIAINLIAPKIDYLSGLEKGQRMDPKAYPRTPQHEDAASAATDALRFVIDQQRYHQARSACFKELLIEGAMGLQVGVTEGPRGVEIELTQCPWDRMIWDPHSRAYDFSDARYLGLIVWMDVDQARNIYGNQAVDALMADRSGLVGSDTWDDKPNRKAWVDKKRQRVRIVQMWHHEADGWHYCEFTKNAKLAYGPSMFLGDDGRPTHPFVWTSAFIDRDLNRYGAVRRLIDPQDDYNKRSSKATHLLSVAQIIADAGAVEDKEKARQEVARPDGYVELQVPSARFEVDRNVDLAASHFQVMQQRRADIEAMGPNAALQGKSDKDQSGRALIAQQQGGMVELGDLLDRLRDFDHRVYRAVWRCIRQFWQGETWVRVTDDERNLRWVGINVPAMDPQTGQMVMQNAVAEMDVDIVIDEAPNVAVIQEEQFRNLTEIAPVVLQAAPPLAPVVVKMLVQASQLRNKDEMISTLEQALAQSQQPQADPRMELEAAKMQAESQKAQMDATLKAQDVELDREKMAFERMKMGFEAEKLRAEQAMREREMMFTAAQAEAERNAKQAAAGVPEARQTQELVVQSMAQLTQAMAAMAQAMNRPKRLVRGPDGRAMGVE